MNKKLKNEELNRPSLEEFKAVKKLPIVVVLDNIRSLNNIGSVFRTSDAFAIQAIYLTGITAKPPHREMNKTALGATESVEWHYAENTVDLIQRLKTENYTIIGIEQTENSVQLQDFVLNLNNQYALIFGHEVNGVQQEVINQCDHCLEIPQHGTKHSLNISVSAGVVLWEFSKFLYANQ